MFELALQFRTQRAAVDGLSDEAPQSVGRNRAIRVIHAVIHESPRIPGVPAESLIASFPRQDHRHLLSGKPCHRIQRHARGPHDWLVLVPDEPRQALEELFAAQPNFMMIGTNMGRYLTRITEFAEGFFTIANRKGFDLIAANL